MALGTGAFGETEEPEPESATLFAQNQPDFNSVDCPIDCDAVIGTPSRPSTTPPNSNK